MKGFLGIYSMWKTFDPYLLSLYGLTGVKGLDGLIGTFLISMLASVIGEFTISIVFRINRKHLDSLNTRLKKYGDLSQQAATCGDEISYRALNKEANEAYGQVFFNRFGLSAASLWPAFFALDWIQLHFRQTGINVPFYDSGVNYFLVFLFCYMAARILFGRIKRYLPYFKGQYAVLLDYNKNDQITTP